MKSKLAGKAERQVAKLKDVAIKAGCSVATASRVLNGNTKVGEVDRNRVMAAATELGYVPNNSARSLRVQSTRLVGVIIPTLDHAIYARMVDGLQDRLAASGMSVIINTASFDPERERVQARNLVGRGIEAIVLVGAEHHADLVQELRRAGVVQVNTYTNDAGTSDAAVGFDNCHSASLAARYLLDLGHRRFGMIAGVTNGNDRARLRRTGFVETLSSAGILPEDIVVVEETYTIDRGRSGMQYLMQTYPRPTAIFCGSDILAVGAVKYCAAAKIDVPKDVSVLGFDNLEITQLITPALSTLDVPAREMGEAAAKIIIESKERPPNALIVPLQTRLIVRESTGQAPK